jgi:hypothetical protein
MARLPGDPGVVGWLRFSAGFRLPTRNHDWVRHELTDAGWRGRTLFRHLAVIVPICAILAVLADTLSPAPLWLILMTIALILSGSIFSVAAYADDIRASRLRQHGMDVPNDPDLGHPTH